MSGHTLSLKAEKRFGVNVKVVCHEPEGAPCRLSCSEGCEMWKLDGHQHELVDYGSCTLVEWLENIGVEECYDGDNDVKLHDGMAVRVWFNGDGVLWEKEVYKPPPQRRRLKSCVEEWPDCISDEYNPLCCRFPKSCSCDYYDDDLDESFLEPMRGITP